MKLRRQWIWMCAAIGLVIQVQGQEMNVTKTFSQVGEPFYFQSTAARETSPQSVLPPVNAAAAKLYDHGDPTIQEQYMLELVNRARSNPQAEVERLAMINLNEGLPAGTLDASPKAPLAFHPLLFVSARAHSHWMLEEDIFSHQGAGGLQPMDRMKAAGYKFSGAYAAGENIAWVGSTGPLDINRETESLHNNLFRSPSHRGNILDKDFCETGIGIELGLFTVAEMDAANQIRITTYNALMGTQSFARSDASQQPFVLGVVYNDRNGNQFYDPGEGISGITVRVSESDYYAVTSESGGYTVPYQRNGSTRVTFEGNEIVSERTFRLDLSGENVHLNYAVNEPAPEPPQISQQPQSATVSLWENVTFSVTVTNPDGMNYQWLKDGQPISGATSDTYTLENVQPADEGVYEVMLSNLADTLLSQGAVLKVLAPTVYVRAQDVSRLYGVENPPLLYTLTDKEGLEVTPGGIPLLETSATQISPTGTYPIIISQGTLNPLYRYEFFEGTLTILENPDFKPLDFVSHPLNQSLYSGESLTLSVEVLGVEPITYQWYRDGAILEGATSPVLYIARTHPEDAGTYQVEVSNDFATSRSQEAIVTLLPYHFVIRADSLERPYGAGNPQLTYSVKNSEGGEPLFLPEGSPELTTTATAESPAGIYPISISQGSLEEFHSYQFEEATLTITPITATLRYDQGDPTNQEQYLLEMINQARANPQGEASRLGIELGEGFPEGQTIPDSTPKPPLALNPALLQSARGHSTWLIAEDQWSPVGQGGSTSKERMAAAGYIFDDSLGWSCTENISTYDLINIPPVEAVRNWHANLFQKSWTYQRNALNGDFQEIGPGLVEGQFDYFTEGEWHLMGTIDFASSGASHAPYVTGVIYDDLNSNGLYDMGEGVPNIVISLVGGQDYAVSSSSGGYSFPYTGEGEREILFEGALLKTPRKFKITLGTQNVKQDLRTSDPYEEVHEKPTLTWSYKPGKLTLTFTGKLESSSDLIHWELLRSTSPCEIPLGTPMKYYRAVN